MFKTLIFLNILIMNTLIADDHKNIDCNVLIEFASENINILPITKMPYKNTKCVSGHHHLIVDSELPNLKRPIPSGKNYLHFGKGQEEASIFLEEGTHTLQLLLGDYSHTPHDQPVYSEKILIKIINP